MDYILEEIDRLRQKVTDMQREKEEDEKEKEKEKDVVTKPESLSYRVTEKLRKRKVPTKLLGYRYLRTAIEIAYEDDGSVFQITKHIYPDVAKEYNTTPTRVERAIRHAIENAHVGESRPSNSEFIASVADELILEDGK